MVVVRGRGGDDDLPQATSNKQLEDKNIPKYTVSRSALYTSLTQIIFKLINSQANVNDRSLVDLSGQSSS